MTKLHMTATVANLAALTALPTTAPDDGAIAFVKSLRSWFVLNKSSTATVDGITCVATSTTGRWIRLDVAHPSWLRHANWYVDPVNGNDENDGTAATTTGTVGPMKTMRELTRRLGPKARLAPPYNASAAAYLVVIHLLDDMPLGGADDLTPSWLIGPDVVVWIRGRVKSTLRTGTFTAVRAADPANLVPWAITDSSVPTSWTAIAGAVGSRIRITSGTRANNYAWIVKDEGGKVGRVSPFGSSTILGSSDSAGPDAQRRFNAIVSPQVGDAYAVETLTRLVVGAFTDISFIGAGNSATNWPPAVYLGEVALSSTNSGSSSTYGLTVGTDVVDTPQEEGSYGVGLKMYSTKVEAVLSTRGHITAVNTHEAGSVYVLSGRFEKLGGATFGAISYGGTYCCHKDPISQGLPVAGKDLLIQSLAVFDASSKPGVVVGSPGAGSAVTHGVLALGAHFESADPVRLWGAGNAAGVSLTANCSLSYSSGATLSITGSGGDYLLNASSTARAWDESSGTFTSARTCSWSNLALAIGSGGLGGNAQDVASGARIATAA